MDHTEAVRLLAAEKYVLRELSPELREQFEEHFCDCAECAKDLQALVTFVTASSMVFGGNGISSPASSSEPQTTRPGWFGWLRPVIAVPAIAALAAVIVFQNAVTIPAAKKLATSQGGAVVYEATFRLQGATRSGSVAKVVVRPGESFALEFDFTPSQVFPSYKGDLVDSSGHAVRTFELTDKQNNKELRLLIPGGIVQPGNYDLVVVGDTTTLKQGPRLHEVLRIPFVVELEL